MFIDALLLIQDVQLLCFTIIFGFVALQHRGDPTRRWFFYSFVANAVGAVLDFTSPHLPGWLARGVNLEMIPLSYVLVNVAIVYFMRRGRVTFWISAAILVGTLPYFLAWSGRAEHWSGDALQDLTIGLQSIVTAFVLLSVPEKSTRPPRVLMSAFFFPFAAIELTRAFVALVLRHDPDVWSGRLEMTSSVAFVVSTSVLPLAFVWMLNSRLESDLLAQNLQDPLTHVMNRRGLRVALDVEVERQAETGLPLSLAILDLDYFKKLNDRHGHACGDAVLCGVASLLRETLRDGDTVARMGGEEFVLVLPGMGPGDAVGLLEKIRIKVEEYEETSGGEVVRTTASLGGVTVREGEAWTASELLRAADAALYRAKEDGRNRVQMHGE